MYLKSGISAILIAGFTAHAGHAISYDAVADAKLEILGIESPGTVDLTYDLLFAGVLLDLPFALGNASAFTNPTAFTIPDPVTPRNTVETLDKTELGSTVSGNAVFPGISTALLATGAFMQFTNNGPDRVAIEFRFDYKVEATVSDQLPGEFGFALAIAELFAFTNGDILGEDLIQLQDPEEYEFFAESQQFEWPEDNPNPAPPTLPPVDSNIVFVVELDEGEFFAAETAALAVGAANRLLPVIPVPPALPLLGTAIVGLIALRRAKIGKT